jgi:hypothetical protein
MASNGFGITKEEQYTEEELIQRIDTAWEWSQRGSKLFFKNEQQKATPEQIGAWEPMVDYFDSLIALYKAILNIKIADRLEALSSTERILEEQRMVADCRFRCSAGKLAYYDQVFSMAEAQQSIKIILVDLNQKIKGYCSALRAFGLSESSDFWPEKICEIIDDKQVTAEGDASAKLTVKLDELTVPVKKRKSKAPGELNGYRKSIASILYLPQCQTTMEVAQKMSLDNPYLPIGYRSRIDGTIKSFAQLIIKNPLLLKRFTNTVSEVKSEI